MMSKDNQYTLQLRSTATKSRRDEEQTMTKQTPDMKPADQTY